MPFLTPVAVPQMVELPLIAIGPRLRSKAATVGYDGWGEKSLNTKRRKKYFLFKRKQIRCSILQQGKAKTSTTPSSVVSLHYTCSSRGFTSQPPPIVRCPSSGVNVDAMTFDEAVAHASTGESSILQKLKRERKRMVHKFSSRKL
jgi:hypothetical protein